MKYEGCFRQVSWIRSYKGISRKFQDSLKGDVRKFQGHYKVLRMIQGSLRVV